ncbi:hypothetical protein [Evansella tamaricis]|uniref:Uncharacterized protein n=1 Tax=Evansella tamaricis TaxID=2069301 RepID=A0ABS6JJL0_9BACI|nr:hypothetical protein [Evansella tamaricis]MBU9713771.1 hypothetical protein [Evansella tamaricis]
MFKKQLKKFKTTFSVPFIYMAMAPLVARLIGENHSYQAFKECDGYAHGLGTVKVENTTFSVPMRVGAGARQRKAKAPEITSVGQCLFLYKHLSEVYPFIGQNATS